MLDDEAALCTKRLTATEASLWTVRAGTMIVRLVQVRLRGVIHRVVHGVIHWFRYGYEVLLTLHNLEKLGLFTKRGAASPLNW